MVSRDHEPSVTAVTSGQAHTPGPWEWACGLVPPDGPQRYADIYKDGGDLIIAQFNDLIPEGRADARLIAAAPELLEAVRDLLGIIHCVCPEYDEATMCANARAAISKAQPSSAEPEVSEDSRDEQQ